MSAASGQYVLYGKLGSGAASVHAALEMLALPGLFCSTPMVALSRAVGRKKAMEMLLTGDLIPAREALAAGLVNTVVPAAELERATHTLATNIVAASPLVVGIGKQAFYRQLEMPQHQAYDYAMEVMSFNATFADAQEGMCAFLEKRHPEWRNK